MDYRSLIIDILAELEDIMHPILPTSLLSLAKVTFSFQVLQYLSSDFNLMILLNERFGDDYSH